MPTKVVDDGHRVVQPRRHLGAAYRNVIGQFAEGVFVLDWLGVLKQNARTVVCDLLQCPAKLVEGKNRLVEVRTPPTCQVVSKKALESRASKETDVAFNWPKGDVAPIDDVKTPSVVDEDIRQVRVSVGDNPIQVVSSAVRFPAWWALTNNCCPSFARAT